MEKEFECPICYDNIENIITCEKCHHEICLKCYECLKDESCPFCRSSFSLFQNNNNQNNNQTIYSSSYPPPSNPFTTLNDWNHSRILRRQIRRERKRQDYELQQIRNAELSRIHNKKSKKDKKTGMMFYMDDIFI